MTDKVIVKLCTKNVKFVQRGKLFCVLSREFKVKLKAFTIKMLLKCTCSRDKVCETQFDLGKDLGFCFQILPLCGQSVM